MSAANFNPVRITANLWRHRHLAVQLIKRDVLFRYRGAYFGLLWVFLNPLIMLSIFTFVFGQIFQARWPHQTGGIPLVLNLYCGLIAFNLFAETISRSPSAVRSYPSYVKKIIFPVEILPVVPLGSALIHAGFNACILTMAMVWTGHLHGFALLFPLLLAPLLLAALGMAWFLATWGVFIKDMNQIVPVFVQMMMFLSPVFYPAQVVPVALQPLYTHNPLGSVIEALRSALAGEKIDWSSWGSALAISIVIFILGHAFFQRNRDEFADAL